MLADAGGVRLLLQLGLRPRVQLLQLVDLLGVGRVLEVCEVEEQRQFGGVGGILVEVPEVGVLERFCGLDPGLSVIGEHAGDEVDQFLLGLVLVQNHLPRSGLEGGKVVVRALLLLVQVDVFLRRSAQDLHDLDQLFLRTVARKDGLEGQQLHHNAARRPHVDLSAVVRGLQHQLRRAVVPRTDIGHVALLFIKDLRRAKIAHLQLIGLVVDQDVGRLEVAVADLGELDEQRSTCM